jgi:hypothetical protein
LVEAKRGRHHLFDLWDDERIESEKIPQILLMDF